MLLFESYNFLNFCLNLGFKYLPFKLRVAGSSHTFIGKRFDFIEAENQLLSRLYDTITSEYYLAVPIPRLFVAMRNQCNKQRRGFN